MQDTSCMLCLWYLKDLLLRCVFALQSYVRYRVLLPESFAPSVRAFCPSLPGPSTVCIFFPHSLLPGPRPRQPQNPPYCRQHMSSIPCWIPVSRSDFCSAPDHRSFFRDHIMFEISTFVYPFCNPFACRSRRRPAPALADHPC